VAAIRDPPAGENQRADFLVRAQLSARWKRQLSLTGFKSGPARQVEADFKLVSELCAA
jgi:hypothetical protein